MADEKKSKVVKLLLKTQGQEKGSTFVHDMGKDGKPKPTGAYKKLNYAVYRAIEEDGSFTIAGAEIEVKGIVPSAKVPATLELVVQVE